MENLNYGDSNFDVSYLHQLLASESPNYANDMETHAPTIESDNLTIPP